MKKFLTAIAAAVIGSVLAAPAAAQAADLIPVDSPCHGAGWGVPADEKDLLPTQKSEGFEFVGPSIVHRDIDPVSLAALPAASFTTVGEVTGNKPLIKFETASEEQGGTGYSTINQSPDGYWSSKIPAGEPGGQDHPVEHAADLIGLWSGYTEASRVITVGIGYANDSGNRAVVSSLTFGTTTYDLTCAPDEESTTSASPSPSQTSSATPEPSQSSRTAAADVVTTTEPPASGGGAASLPITGPGIGGWVVFGAVLLVVGSVAYVLARRRRFEA